MKLPLGEILSDLSEKTRVQSSIPRWDYLMTLMRVITTYLRLMVFPVNQNLDYDYPIYHSLFTPSVFLSFLLLASLMGTAVYLIYKVQNAESSMPYALGAMRLAGFGILCIAYVSKGMFDEGIQHYRMALRLKPDYAEAYNNLGVAYASKEMIDHALGYFEYATRLKPDYFEAYYNLALLYLKRNDQANASHVYERLAKTNPEGAQRVLALIRQSAR